MNDSMGDVSCSVYIMEDAAQRASFILSINNEMVI